MRHGGPCSGQASLEPVIQMKVALPSLKGLMSSDSVHPSAPKRMLMTWATVLLGMAILAGLMSNLICVGQQSSSSPYDSCSGCNVPDPSC